MCYETEEWRSSSLGEIRLHVWDEGRVHTSWDLPAMPRLCVSATVREYMMATTYTRYTAVDAADDAQPTTHWQCHYAWRDGLMNIQSVLIVQLLNDAPSLRLHSFAPAPGAATPNDIVSQPAGHGEGVQYHMVYNRTCMALITACAYSYNNTLLWRHVQKYSSNTSTKVWCLLLAVSSVLKNKGLSFIDWNTILSNLVTCCYNLKSARVCRTVIFPK